MQTSEQEVGIGLAYLHARDRKRLCDEESWQWAKEHWPEFLAEFDRPVGLGTLIEVDTTRPVDVPALALAVLVAFSRPPAASLP